MSGQPELAAWHLQTGAISAIQRAKRSFLESIIKTKTKKSDLLEKHRYFFN
jgi:hypothetical protein